MRDEVKKKKNPKYVKTREKIISFLNDFGGATVMDIHKGTNFSRTTLYKHLNKASKNNDEIIMYEESMKKYYVEIHYIREVIYKNKIDNNKAHIEYVVNPKELRKELEKNYKEKRSSIKDISVKDVSNAEEYFWFYSLFLKIWNLDLTTDDMDFEIFLAARTLVLAILKKIKNRKIPNMNIKIQLEFDPLTATYVKVNELLKQGLTKDQIKKMDTNVLHIAMDKILQDARELQLKY